MDIVEMYHPMKLLLLSDDGGAARYFFLQVFPFLVVLPGAFSYMRDLKTGIFVFNAGRKGKHTYILSKGAAVFLTTFIVFVIPLLAEILLNCVAFPIRAIGDPSNINLYNVVYIELVDRFMFKNIFVNMPYLYALMMNVFVAVGAGVLGTFVYAISLFRIKYKIILFFPVYILLNVFALLPRFIGKVDFSMNYFNYMTLYDSHVKNESLMLLLYIFLMIVSFVVFWIKGKKDLI